VVFSLKEALGQLYLRIYRLWSSPFCSMGSEGSFPGIKEAKS